MEGKDNIVLDEGENCVSCKNGCSCCEEKLSKDHDDGNVKLQIIKILIAVALFAGAFFAKGLIGQLMLGIAYFVVGYNVIVNAVKDLIKDFSIDEEFLMSIATAGAWAIGESFEAVAVMLLYSIGELLEDIACKHSRKSITALLKLRPDSVTVNREGKQQSVPLEEVCKGDTAIFKPGERIAVDGIITSGETTVDNSALTGESLPEEKKPGDAVHGGGLNKTGAIEVMVTKPYAQSSSARILELVENAQEKKAKAERFITRFAKKYTIAVVLLALVVAFIFPIFTGYSSTFKDWFYRGLTLLVVSCPCAFVISVPLSFFAGIGCASRNGILIKGATSIEKLAKTKAVALDKTGTVTKGDLSVKEVIGGSEVLKLAAHAECRSTHPIAKAILKAYGEPDYGIVANITEEAGRGVRAKVMKDEIFVGKGEMQGSGITVSVLKNGEEIGAIVLSDQIKPESFEAISSLKEIGVSEIVMLSGDREAAASEIAKKAGIPKVKASLSPEDKCSELEKIKADVGITAFVGDGINDAPVLAMADIGIAMGGLGSDAAIETADVVILDDKLSRLPAAIKISRRTMKIVYQCVLIAFLAKLAVIVLELLGIAGMWSAVFADVGVTIICILNSLRALNYKVKHHSKDK